MSTTTTTRRAFAARTTASHSATAAARAKATLSARKTRRTTAITALISAAAVVGAPLFLDSYWLYLGSSLLAYAIVVMGTRVLFGIAGIFSLAQASFVGLGAYTAAISATVLKLDGWIEFILVIAVSAAAALLVGIPALRVSGLRLALLTLAFGELFQWIVRDQRAITGGSQGIYADYFYLPGIDTTDPFFLYGMCAFFALLVTLVLSRLPATQLGRNMAAVRESEFSARSVGVDVSKTKLIAFIIAGVCAGLSGFLVAHVAGSVTPTNFDLFSSVYILVGVILGGTGSTLGAWIGAAYISLVPPLFASLGHDRLYVLLSGAILIALIYVLPGGLVQLSGLLRRRRILKETP